MSKQLIKVELSKLNDETIQSVSARELHKFLKVKTQFTHWINYKIKQYNFLLNIDYIAISKSKLTAQGNKTNFIDYVVSIEMAKQLAMLENNEEGKKARLYFINCEKLLKEKLKQEKIRQELKLENVEMTDALKDFRMDKGKDTQSHHYINEYNLINRLVLGMDTKKYKEKNNIPSNANLRDYLMPIEIDLIMKLQKANTIYIDEGLEYEQRKQKLTNLFENRYKTKLIH